MAATFNYTVAVLKMGDNLQRNILLIKNDNLKGSEPLENFYRCFSHLHNCNYSGEYLTNKLQFIMLYYIKDFTVFLSDNIFFCFAN